MFVRLIPCLALVFLISCTSSSTNFYWGTYEATLYEKYESSDGLEPSEELRRLLADVEKSQAEGKKIAPGINLHIAMLHSQMGNIEAAKQFIKAEKLLYPVSENFSNSVFKKIKQ